jgi:cytochrome c oxidase cbb3-type subunit III
MSRTPPIAAVRFLYCALFAAASLACEREDRPFSRLTLARGDAPVTRDGRVEATGPRHTTHNAFSVSEGARLFVWFNCSGCHGSGGGGHIGPALTDAEWRYGAGVEDIHTSIADGRPNGMPGFRGRIVDEQIWQLSAYVLALSGRVPQDVAPSRLDAISTGEPPVMHEPQSPKPEKPHL